MVLWEEALLFLIHHLLLIMLPLRAVIRVARRELLLSPHLKVVLFRSEVKEIYDWRLVLEGGNGVNLASVAVQN